MGAWSTTIRVVRVGWVVVASRIVRRCHAKVHRTKVIITEFPPLLLVLWPEHHPEGHEQTYLDFNVRKPAAQNVPLTFAPTKKE